MIKVRIVFVLLVWASSLSAQTTPNSFEILLKDFEKEYSKLAIPGLELSYVNNLRNIASKEELRAQKQFFQKYQDRLEQYPAERLSEEDQVTYNVLMYEIS